MIPFPRRATYYESVPVLESFSPLLANGIITSGDFDLVDVLRVGGQQGNFSGSPVFYTYDPGRGDPRWWLHYSVRVFRQDGADFIITPGELFILGAPIDPLTGALPSFFPELHSIPISGPVAIVRGTVTPGTVAAGAVLTGSFPVHTRGLRVTYQNGPIDQQIFELGIYLRPTP